MIVTRITPAQIFPTQKIFCFDQITKDPIFTCSSFSYFPTCCRVNNESDDGGGRDG